MSKLYLKQTAESSSTGNNDGGNLLRTVEFAQIGDTILYQAKIINEDYLKVNKMKFDSLVWCGNSDVANFSADNCVGTDGRIERIGSIIEIESIRKIIDEYKIKHFEVENWKSISEELALRLLKGFARCKSLRSIELVGGHNYIYKAGHMYYLKKKYSNHTVWGEKAGFYGYTANEGNEKPITEKIRKQFSNSMSASFLANLLKEEIEQCKVISEDILDKFKMGMSIDAIKSRRLDFMYKAFGDILMAAAYSVPMCGSTVQHVVKLFRNRSLNDAWWLARNDASWIGMGANGGKLFGQEWNTGYGNSVHAPVVMKQDASQGDDNNYRSTAFTAASDAPWWEDGKPGNMFYQAEGDIVGAISDLKGEFPQGISANNALKSLGLADAKSNDWEDVLAISSHKKIIAQMSEASSQGEKSLIPYMFASIVSEVELSETGSSISAIGGWRNKNGHFALGEDEYKEGETEEVKKKYNRIADGLVESTWIAKYIKMTKAQKRLNPSARNVYESQGFSSKQIDEIFNFKCKITSYRKKIEDKLGQLKIGELSKKIVADMEAESLNLKKHGFKKHGRFYKSTIGKHGVLRILGQLATFNYKFKTTDAADERSRLFVDCYIIYKVLELHLGTPWLASLVPNTKTIKKVANALLDAYVTVVMSKSQGPERNTYLPVSNYDWDNIKPEAGIFASPTICAFWSVISSKVMGWANINLVRSKLKNEFLKIDISAYSDTMPCFTDETPLPKNIKKHKDRFLSKNKIEDVAEHLLKGSKERYDELLTKFTDVNSEESLNMERMKTSFARIISKCEWEKIPQPDGQKSYIKDYTNWVENRTFLKGALNEYKSIEETVSSFGVKEYDGGKVLDAYATQKLAMSLMLKEIEKPEVVLKTMHDTIRELIKCLNGNNLSLSKNKRN